MEEGREGRGRQGKAVMGLNSQHTRLLPPHRSNYEVPEMLVLRSKIVPQIPKYQKESDRIDSES